MNGGVVNLGQEIGIYLQRVVAVYRSLDANKILETVVTLQSRINERFAGAGLGGLAAELRSIAEESMTRAAWIAQPLTKLRLLVAAFAALCLLLILRSFLGLELSGEVREWTQLAQGLESGINDFILIGAGLFFLFTTETRIKRARALKAIHELRALAHIVDMHQLTKDPEKLLSPLPNTASSPKRTMTKPELSRYLDYCSEMLALISKISALYVQNFNDPIALQAVDEIETLTSGLSRKIWQKIMLIHTGEGGH